MILLSGCRGGVEQSSFTYHDYRFRANYTTFEHPFTDAGAADARRLANKQCAETKLLAVRTSRSCSLQKCVANFQCMNEEEAAGYPVEDRTQ